MIKAIIFDIGGVLVPNLGKIIKSKVHNKYFIKNYHKYSNILDSGAITLKELNNKFKKYSKLNLVKVFIEAAQKSKIDKKVKNIVLRLKRNYKLIYLSNTFKEHYLVRKKQHVYDPFLFGINSYKYKIRKPNRIIYKIALKKLKLSPEECLFIDDKKENIKTAKKLKINTILFKNAKNLIKELRKFNLKI